MVPATIDPIMMIEIYTHSIVKLAWTHRRSIRSMSGVMSMVINPDIRITTMSDSIM